MKMFKLLKCWFLDEHEPTKIEKSKTDYYIKESTCKHCKNKILYDTHWAWDDDTWRMERGE